MCLQPRSGNSAPRGPWITGVVLVQHRPWCPAPSRCLLSKWRWRRRDKGPGTRRRRRPARAAGGTKPSLCAHDSVARQVRVSDVQGRGCQPWQLGLEEGGFRPTGGNVGAGGAAEDSAPGTASVNSVCLPVWMNSARENIYPPLPPPPVHLPSIHPSTVNLVSSHERAVCHVPDAGLGPEVQGEKRSQISRPQRT